MDWGERIPHEVWVEQVAFSSPSIASLRTWYRAPKPLNPGNQKEKTPRIGPQKYEMAQKWPISYAFVFFRILRAQTGVRMFLSFFVFPWFWGSVPGPQARKLQA